MADQFANQSAGLASPVNHAVAVTPHDTNELANYSRGLYVGGAGDVKVTTLGDEETTFVGVVAGSVLPVRAKIVWATGTSATDLVALY